MAPKRLRAVPQALAVPLEEGAATLRSGATPVCSKETPPASQQEVQVLEPSLQGQEEDPGAALVAEEVAPSEEGRSTLRGRFQVPPLHIDPMGYEDMVRRVSVPEETPEEARDAQQAPNLARRRIALGALCTKSRPPKSAEGGEAVPVKLPQKSGSGAPGMLYATGFAATCGAKKPKMHRPSALHPNPQARGTETRAHEQRRTPCSARGTERSPSNPRPARPRPLPLEMGAMRTMTRGEDGPSQPGSASGMPSSARRGRRPGRPSPKPDEESMSPSPTAAASRRRRMLHKTAEIYGAPVITSSHRHAPAPKSTDRHDESRLGTGIALRSEEDMHEKQSLASTAELPTEVLLPATQTMYGVNAGYLREEAEMGLFHTPVLQPRPAPVLPSSPWPPERLGELIPAAAVELDNLTHSPGSCYSMVLAAQAAQAEADDEIIFCAPSRRPLVEAQRFQGGQRVWPDWAKALEFKEGDTEGEAGSAFGATVRHWDQVPLSARFQAFSRPGSRLPAATAASPMHQAPAPAGFELSLAPRHVAGEGGELQALEDCTVLGKLQRMVSSPRGEAATCSGSGESGDSGSATYSHLAGSPSSGNLALLSEGVEDKDLFEVDEQSLRPDLSTRQRPLSASDDSRRIKSLSPPRKCKRPQPFVQLDKVPATGQPSSAPCESQHRHLEPLLHLNRPLAPSTSRLRGKNELHEDDSTPKRAEALSKPATTGAQEQASESAHRPFTPPVLPIGKLLKSVYTVQHMVEAEKLSSEVDFGDTSMLEALYDPLLEIYYDPKNNAYYERKPVVAGA